jgi:predicted DNA-binding protein
MKTAISLPDPLFHSAEDLARRLGITRSEVFQRAVSAFIESHRDAAITEALNRVYGPGGEDSAIDPTLETLQMASLQREDWD